MKEVSELFEEFVNNIDNTINVTGNEYSDNNTHFLTCDTKWARKGKIMKIQIDEQVANNVYIKDVVKNERIVIEGTHYPISISLSNPFDISGTKISTNNEWNKASNNLLSKTPIIWLYSNYQDTIYGLESSLERTFTMNIAFLDETSPKYQKNKDHIDNVVIPMKELVDSFIKSIDKNAIYKKLKQYNIKTYSRFGVESEKGVIQNILDADLGGVVLNITLDKFKEPCKC